MMQYVTISTLGDVEAILVKKPDYLVDHMGFDRLPVGFHSECVVPELELEVHKERALEPSTSFLDVAVIHSLFSSFQYSMQSDGEEKSSSSMRS